jgi:hypothetical protein
MTIKEELDELFADMLARRGTKRRQKALASQITSHHIDVLLDKIAAIGDPADYCDDQETYVPVEPFFEFVDYVSALIISMGEGPQDKVSAYPDGDSRYVPWVKKYVLDSRFHAQLLQKLP